MGGDVGGRARPAQGSARPVIRPVAAAGWVPGGAVGDRVPAGAVAALMLAACGVHALTSVTAATASSVPAASDLVLMVV